MPLAGRTHLDRVDGEVAVALRVACQRLARQCAPRLATPTLAFEHVGDVDEVVARAQGAGVLRGGSDVDTGAQQVRVGVADLVTRPPAGADLGQQRPPLHPVIDTTLAHRPCRSSWNLSVSGSD